MSYVSSLAYSYYNAFLSPPFENLSFFFTDPATTEIYTLSLHDALPISERYPCSRLSITPSPTASRCWPSAWTMSVRDRKSTRLNSSHRCTSYAVFCLKKKTRRGGRRDFIHLDIKHRRHAVTSIISKQYS